MLRILARRSLSQPLIRPLRASIMPLKISTAQLRFVVRNITTVQHIPNKRRWPLYLFFGTIIGAYGYWKWLIHHNFPASVAKLLKEGLWATINGAGYRKPDYRKALVKYIEALQEADRLEMVPWSDEYTGIQIIIGDMYERLHMYDEAAAMYAEISTTYLIALSSNVVPAEQRDKLITRDLRVVLLAGLLMSMDVNKLKAAVEFMGPHLVLATREAAMKSEELQFMLQEFPVFNIGYLRDIADKRLPTSMVEQCWGSYRNEVFAMREMMTGIAAANGECMQALMIKLKTMQLMLVSGFTVGECLLSADNIASLMYLHAVKLRFSAPAELANQPAMALLSNPTNSDSEIMANNLPTTSKTIDNPRGLPLKEAVPLKEAPAQPTSDAAATQPQEAGTLYPSGQQFLDLSRNVFSEVIAIVKKLDQRRTDFISEAYSMALYGLGVIACSEGDYDLAADTLGEARLRAKGNQLQPLIAMAEDEIAKVEKLRGISDADIKKLNADEIPSVDIMFWKLTPDIEDLDRPELPDTRL